MFRQKSKSHVTIFLQVILHFLFSKKVAANLNVWHSGDKSWLLTFNNSRGRYLKPHTLVHYTLTIQKVTLTPKNRKALFSSSGHNAIIGYTVCYS